MTARQEILEALPAVRSRTGSEVFTPADVVAELHRRGTTLADSTIRTHIVSVMCRDAPANHLVHYDDLERVGRGRYRPSRP